MSKGWPLVKLGDVLAEVDTSIPVEKLGTVQLAGVYSFGRGLFKRGDLNTGGTSYKKYNRLHTGDFVISQPKAWEGALALVTDEFDGWFLSPVFPTFRCDQGKLAPSYLSWWSKQEHVWSSLLFKSRGIGARRESVSPTEFLSLEIPLPPLAEQRRLVARIEAVAALVQQAQALRKEIERDLMHLSLAAYRTIVKDSPRSPLEEVAPLTRRPVIVDATKVYPQISARSFGRGTFYQPPLAGSAITWQKPFEVRSGDILISNIKAWEGAIAVVKDEDDGRICSHRYLTCSPKSGISGAFVAYHLLTEEGLYHIGEASPGSADRNRTLGTTALKKIPVPVPSTAKQMWFENLLAQLESTKALQAETQAELDGLMGAVLGEVFGGQGVRYGEQRSELSVAAEP